MLNFQQYRMQTAVSLFFLLVFLGTLGYRLTEHWGFLDSLFMTVITVSGVGYGEIHNLDRAGMIFSIVLIVFGVGVVAWSLVTTVEVLMSEQRLREVEKRRTKRLIDSMKNHFIVCGFGRMGRSIVEGYQSSDYPYVVIESDAARAEELRAEGIPCIAGDAASDEALKQAGIDRAKALITVTPSDAINTFIILSARWLNPSLMIVARAVSPDSVPKLYRAGATKVISPHVLGGWWMAATAINPAATDFIEGLRNAEGSKTSLYEFTAGAHMHRKVFGEMDFKANTGALVVAVRRGSTFTANPSDKYVMEAGDAIIAIGSVKELNLMAELVNPDKPATVELVSPTLD